jgi:hypothetical protein
MAVFNIQGLAFGKKHLSADACLFPAFLINPTELWNRVTTVDQEDSKPSVEDSLANTILVECV